VGGAYSIYARGGDMVSVKGHDGLHSVLGRDNQHTVVFPSQQPQPANIYLFIYLFIEQHDSKAN